MGTDRWAMDEHRELALMNTDRWCCWGYTDHQGTLIITVSVTAREEERNTNNRH
ncbi:unnamed protein product, partial [Staurois parvus]